MSGSLLFRVSIPSDRTIEKVLSDILTELKVKNPIWLQSSEDGINYTFKQVLFYIENGTEAEDAIKLLTENEIGVTPHSSIGLFQCYLLYEGFKESSPRVKLSRPEDEAYSWDKFVESVRPRLAIAQIIESVKKKATFTFDFLILLIVAALTASLGLVEDNQLILAASMLISPLMFPMVATTFGTVIRLWMLQKLGIVNGLFGLLLCLIIGFTFGLIASLVQEYHTISEWPTTLMYSMGTVRSLWTGIILAILSGTAVSIGILGDDSGSIQGVAISAALLPPAVNAGLLWSRSLLIATIPSFPSTIRQIWSTNPSFEFAILGAISLGLSFLNILFIFMAGNLFLKVKEAASWKQRNDMTWQRLRKFKPFTKEETENITIRIEQELEKMHHWTVTPNMFHSEKFMRGLETWSGGKPNDYRPTAQHMAHVLAPIPWAVDQESHYSQQSSSASFTPSNGQSRKGYRPMDTPQSSRFTVVPVQTTNNSPTMIPKQTSETK